MGGVLLAVSGLAATAREPWTASRVVGSPNPPAPYAVERRHPGQQFQNPVELAFMPGAPRLFVAEQGGKVWSFDTRSNGAARDLVIDLRQHHQPFDNILGFTFHPGFATNRFIFINYNEPGGRPAGAHVSRFTVSSLHPPVIDPTSERIVIRWMSGEHNGCALAFGSDGFLYISTGDSAPPDPPDGKLQTGQDLRDLMASILRIDVDRTEGTNQYAIPRDNPFVNTPGARPEVYAFGLRNPFRMAFDRVTGDLLAADVGFEQWEMIYRVKAGGNYGWPITEGPNLRVRMDVKQGPGPILPPLVAIPHSDGASVTGGQFYRGKKLPKLHGAYLYGDWETGKFWGWRAAGRSPPAAPQEGPRRRTRSGRKGAAGTPLAAADGRRRAAPGAAGSPSGRRRSARRRPRRGCRHVRPRRRLHSPRRARAPPAPGCAPPTA